MEPNQGLVIALTELGFSQYESRVYVGLMSGYGQTAYALSKMTGVPQPKVYEALRKLVARDAAALVGTKPQKYAAIPPDKLLERFKTDFSNRLAVAESKVTAVLLDVSGPSIWPEVLTGIGGRQTTLDYAASMIADARTKIYISAWDGELQELADGIAAAERRDVSVVVMAFGRTSFKLRQGQLFRHSSTSKTIYPHHQNRHLAVVSDGRDSIWALAVDGDNWSALASQDPRMVGLVRSFVRHDIYIQKIYSQFGSEMESVFGSGLELLADASSNQVLQDRSRQLGKRTKSQLSAG